MRFDQSKFDVWLISRTLLALVPANTGEGTGEGGKGGEGGDTHRAASEAAAKRLHAVARRQSPGSLSLVFAGQNSELPTQHWECHLNAGVVAPTRRFRRSLAPLRR